MKWVIRVWPAVPDPAAIERRIGRTFLPKETEMPRSDLFAGLAAALFALTALAPAPTASALSHELDYGARSLAGDTSVTVEFDNRSGEPLDLFWRDYSGVPVYYTTVQSGRTHRQQTYATHPWELRQRGVTRQVYTATRDGYQRVSFGAGRPVPSGYSVRDVDFGDRAGRHLGVYIETRDGWKEIGDGGARFSFREIGRDEWSVYLHDPSRDVWIQLDLHRGEIFYRGPGEREKRTLYRIVAAR